jgi:hypothetical protein
MPAKDRSHDLVKTALIPRNGLAYFMEALKEFDLKAKVLSAISGYVGEALNGYSYLTTNSDQTLFTVISLAWVKQQRVVDTGLVVRLENDQIIIERDVNNKPLAEALLEEGIPEAKIVRAYSPS